MVTVTVDIVLDYDIGGSAKYMYHSMNEGGNLRNPIPLYVEVCTRYTGEMVFEA